MSTQPSGVVTAFDVTASGHDHLRIDVLEIPVFRDDQHGTAIRLLLAAGARDVVVADVEGVIHRVEKMAKDSIVFALANPVPEVDPGQAREHATVVASGP